MGMHIMLKYLIFLTIYIFTTFGLSSQVFCDDLDEDASGDVKAVEGFPIGQIEELIARFRTSGGAELGSSQLFVVMLCDALGLPRPNAPRPEVADNSYTFEAQVTFIRNSGETATGRIDLYKKGCFVWESKQGSPKISKSDRESLGGWRQGTAVRGTQSWDKAMIQARIQAEEYANGLSVKEGHPPFIIVADIGEG